MRGDTPFQQVEDFSYFNIVAAVIKKPYYEGDSTSGIDPNNSKTRLISSD